ncbi:MAG TPA: serine/threonine-protein kinase [Planctomycetaceae bacterium]|jgi:serine/threonine protein kinase/tetratricopeptide (TPR) repeat protein|nr:serine/threonine-protein kinase [Planctomycetaceae bacterium]
MASSPPPIDEIFLVALGKSTPRERDAFLDDVCRDNAELRRQVERLLAAHPRAKDFLEQPAAVVQGTVIGQNERTAHQRMMVGTLVSGRYKLLEEIAEGGMGTVWVAEQTEPVRRRVAIKLIKPGMDSRQVLSRFEAERQALALMDHPNIAKVLDGGVTDEGRPYFVMEYVKGVPITEFCDQAKVTVAGRLNLFVQVCQAVQHAHQKGIIHRDLKPSNILVCLYDGQPIPKVIDFGLAKAIHQPLTEHTLYTAHGIMVGTPLYMSPEQAEFNNLDIDTRTDIYSLGVILYELLTGTTPLDRQRFKDAAWQEIVRVIKEEEPSKPSTKLSRSGSLPTIAAQRSLEPAQLSRVVRGDLDWIVMKALEKERSRRYETANGLARDLQRHLADEVVEARPPSARYRLRKLVRRNQGLVIAGGLVALVLIFGIAGTTWGMIRAVQAQHAEAARAEGERLAKLEAEAANAQAQKRLAQIEKGNEIITSIFADLDIEKVKNSGEPLEAVLARRLVKAARELEGEAVGDPLVVAGLQTRLGVSLVKLGYHDSAITLFSKSLETRRSRLGANDPQTLLSQLNLASAFSGSEQPDRALPLLEEVTRRIKATRGPEHPDTLLAMSNLAAAYYRAGQLDRSVSLSEETLKLRKATLGPDHPDTLRSMSNLAQGYESIGRFDLAVPLFEETLKVQKAKLGADHPDTLTTMNFLAPAYRRVGKAELALPLLEETVKLETAKLGPNHPSTLATMANLGAAYDQAGKSDLAVALLAKTLELARARLGATHSYTLGCMNNLATAYLSAGKRERALPLYEEALKLTKATQGSEHPSTLNAMHNLASTYFIVGKKDLAVQLFEETLKHRKAKLGPQHPDTLVTSLDLAHVRENMHREDEAITLIDECIRLAGPAAIDTKLVPRVFLMRLRLFQKRKDAAGCLQTATMWENLEHANRGADYFYNAACFRAVAAALLRAEKKSASAVRLARAEADRAMEWLKEAIAAGYKDVANMIEDQDLEALRGRADLRAAIQSLHADLLKTDKPANDFAAVVYRQRLALVHLSAAAHQAWSANDEEYAESGRLALELAKNSDDPTTLERSAKVCTLRPCNDARRVTDALALARKAVDMGKGHQNWHYFLMALGMAEFRSGHWVEADGALVAAIKGQTRDPRIGLTSAFYRAMTLFRQGKPEEARKLATEALAKMKPLPKDEGDILDHDDLITWMAYKEAKELLKLDSTAPTSKHPEGERKPTAD